MLLAAKRQNANLVQLLVDHGMDLDSQRDKNGHTALHIVLRFYGGAKISDYQMHDVTQLLELRELANGLREVCKFQEPSDIF